MFNGTAADAISDEKVKQWQHPAGAYVHALHQGEWGGFHYRITSKDSSGKLLTEGGWQNNRPSPMNDKYRFVENIFEELDAPGEWYYEAKGYGGDKHSMAGDAMFMDAAKGNYQIMQGSVAAQTGFVNVDMNTGVQLPALKKIAARPPVRVLMAESAKGKSALMEWLGATLKNIETLGEQSAAGLTDSNGALVLGAPPASQAFKNGLQKGDVIIKIKEQPVQSVYDLLQIFKKVKWMGTMEITIVRNQAAQVKTIRVNE